MTGKDVQQQSAQAQMLINRMRINYSKDERQQEMDVANRYFSHR